MKVLYAGSFNPWHFGHQYVYDKACKYFGKDNVIVGIGCNPAKPTIDMSFVEWTLKPLNMQVKNYCVLTSKFCRDQGIGLIVRGIRPGKSLEYEEDLMYWNQKLGNVETIFIPTPPEVNQLSSSVIRELHSFGEDITPYVYNRDVCYRWLQRRKPRKKIIFGRSCMGKSTYIQNAYPDLADHEILNVDAAIWNFIIKKKDILYATRLKEDLREAFNKHDFDRFNNVLLPELKNIVVPHWDEFFEPHEIIDFAALGTYFENISSETLAKYQIIKVETSLENRNKYRECRKMSVERLNMLDALYVEPAYWDETIKRD